MDRIIKMPDGRQARIPNDWTDDQIAEFITASGAPEPQESRLDQAMRSTTADPNQLPAKDFMQGVGIPLAGLAGPGGPGRGLVRLGAKAIAPKVTEKTVETGILHPTTGKMMTRVATETGPSALASFLGAMRSAAPGVAKSAVKYGAGLYGLDTILDRLRRHEPEPSETPYQWNK